MGFEAKRIAKIEAEIKPDIFIERHSNTPCSFEIHLVK
jgi:hypothetical protein